MSEPIKIIVTAETQQAAAALEAFVKNSGTGLSAMATAGAKSAEELQKLREAALLTREGFHGLETTALLMGGTSFPQLATAIMEARLAMMSTRSAAQLLGMTLTEIAPWMALLAGAVAGGVVLWETYGGSMESAESRAKRLGDELKKIPDLLANIEAAQKGGNLSGAQADSFRDILAGRTPIYRKTGSSGPGGAFDITTDSRSQITSGRQSGQWRANVPADINNPDDLKAALAFIQKQTPDDNKNDQIKSQNEITDLLRRSHEESLAGIAKERQAAADKYDEDKRKILDLAVTAKLSKEQVNADLVALDADYAGKKKNIDDKEAAEKLRSEEETQRAIEEYNRTNDELDKQIAEEEKKQTEELNKQLQLKQEIGRAQALAQLDSIRGDPLLTDSEKAQQSIAIYQRLIDLNAQRIAQLSQISSNPATDATGQLVAQKQMTDLMVQQAQIQNQMMSAQGENSFSFQLGQAVRQLENMNNLAKEVAATFANTINTSIRSVSSNLTGVIMGTETWAQALRNIYNTIMTEIIQSIIQMGLRWVMTQLMMAMMGRSILAASVAATAPIAAAQSAIWAVPATLSTIASYGSAAAAAPGEIAVASALTLGLSAFADGGVPPVGKMSLVGERGPELFVPNTTGTIIPADKTSAILGGGGGAGASGGKSVSVYSFTDPRQMADHLQRNDDHEKWVVDVMSRNIHKFR